MGGTENFGKSWGSPPKILRLVNKLNPKVNHFKQETMLTVMSSFTKIKLVFESSCAERNKKTKNIIHNNEYIGNNSNEKIRYGERIQDGLKNSVWSALSSTRNQKQKLYKKKKLKQTNAGNDYCIPSMT